MLAMLYRRDRAAVAHSGSQSSPPQPAPLSQTRALNLTAGTEAAVAQASALLESFEAKPHGQP